MGKEFEIKFKATQDQLAAIEAEYGCFSLFSMETTYYDAVDGSLSARHITLRRRLENGSAVCTVKTPLDGLGRGEWDTECDSIEAAIPVLCKLGCPPELPQLAAEGLVEVCGAWFTRRCREVEFAGAVLELALDEGILFAGETYVPLCEIEVELKEGHREQAIAYARILAGAYDLEPERDSKFSRALALAEEG